MPVTIVQPWVRRIRTTASVAQAVAHSFKTATTRTRPENIWPAWALDLKSQQIEGETGIGDTVKRILGQTGETFSAYYKRTTGKDCGCTVRQEMLNRRFPY